MKFVPTIWKKKNIFSVFLTSKSAGGRNQQLLFVILWLGTAKSTLNEPADLSYDARIANPNYNNSLPVFVILPVDYWRLNIYPVLKIHLYTFWGIARVGSMCLACTDCTVKLLTCHSRSQLRITRSPVVDCTEVPIHNDDTMQWISPFSVCGYRICGFILVFW